jgi:hypothetical protein
VETQERTPGGVRGLSYWSSVRLDFFEQVEDLRAADRRLKPGTKQVAVLVEGRFADGELCVPPRSPAVENHKLPREVVQRGAQVVEDLARYESPLGWYRGKPVHDESVLLGLLVELHREAVSVGIEDRTNGLLEIAKMAFRPPDLQVYSPETGSHDPGAES